MKLHRDIQAEYRNEQLGVFIKSTAFVAAIVMAGYFLLEGLAHLVY
jgi:hypothetical protein